MPIRRCQTLSLAVLLLAVAAFGVEGSPSLAEAAAALRSALIKARGLSDARGKFEEGERLWASWLPTSSPTSRRPRAPTSKSSSTSSTPYQ